MPYADPEKRRGYSREYARLRRGGVCQTPSQTLLSPEFRLDTARDVLELLAEQIHAVCSDQAAGTLEKARVVGYLSSIALKAVEAANVSSRIEALEAALSIRKETPCPEN